MPVAFALPEKRGPIRTILKRQTVRTRATPPHHVVSCIEAKRLGVEFAARQNIIDETFKLGPGAENGARLWPWSGRPNGNVPEWVKAQKTIITPGEPKVSPHAIIEGSIHAGPDVSLGDLKEWHTLRAWCRNCSLLPK